MTQDLYPPQVALPPESSALLNDGLGIVAYVKPVTTDDGPGYAVIAANGTQLAVAEDAATAYGYILDQNWSPVSLH